MAFSRVAAVFVASPLLCAALVACGSGVPVAPESLSGPGGSSSASELDGGSASASPSGSATGTSGGGGEGSLAPVVLPDGRQVERPTDESGSLGELDKFASSVPLEYYLRVQDSVSEPFEFLSGVSLSAEQRAAWLYVVSVFSAGNGRDELGRLGFTLNGYRSAEKMVASGGAKWSDIKDGRASAPSAFIMRDVCGGKFSKDLELERECVAAPLIVSASSAAGTVDGVPAVSVTFKVAVQVYESYEIGRMDGVDPLAVVESSVVVTVVPDLARGNEGGWLVWDGVFSGYEVRLP